MIKFSARSWTEDDRLAGAAVERRAIFFGCEKTLQGVVLKNVQVVSLGLNVVMVCLGVAGGCQRSAESSVAAEVTLEIDPDPPRVGTADIAVTLTDSAGRPLSGGALKVEGNMNHAGIKPVFSTFQEMEPGRDQGMLEFTREGDWFLLLTGQLADGRQVNEKLNVPGVQRP